MVEREKTQRTFYYEQIRAVSSGVLETAGITFLVLIAVRWFEAGATAKALVAGGGSVGLLVSPFLVSLVEHSRWPVAKAASRVATLGMTAFLAMALWPVLPVFTLGSVIAMAASSAVLPLLTQVYQDNYPRWERGRLFSKTLVIRIAVSALFSHLAGSALSGHIEYFRWLLMVFAAAFGLAAYSLSQYPSLALVAPEVSHPFRSFEYVGKDPLFLRTLVSWMLMGFANLMMLPLRVEYMANPRYGLELSVAAIALYTGVIPNVARLLLSQVWGRLFDQMNFFVLRMILNVGFGIGIAWFFLSDSITGLFMGALFYGISSAGGDVAWSLWVTKFAPPNRVANYMSIHTFSTGVRGFLAPLLGFHLATFWSMHLIAWLSLGLILVSTLLLVPLIPRDKHGATVKN